MTVPPSPSPSPSPSHSCDVAIVGGGMVGASLALALAPTPLSIVMIEAAPPEPQQTVADIDRGAGLGGADGVDRTARPPSFDDRTTALGNGARRIFQTLGVWDA